MNARIPHMSVHVIIIAYALFWYRLIVVVPKAENFIPRFHSTSESRNIVYAGAYLTQDQHKEPMHCQTLFNHFKMMRSHVIVYLCELFPTEIDAFQNEDHINAIKFDAIKHQIVAPNFNSICHIN